MQSDFLFAQPRALFGVARLLSLFREFSEYNISRTPQEADARALYSDWAITGADLRAAPAQCEEQERAEAESAQGKLFTRV
jgi:hypothetical protein